MQQPGREMPQPKPPGGHTFEAGLNKESLFPFTTMTVRGKIYPGVTENELLDENGAILIPIHTVFFLRMLRI
jgi:hypothetical protein